MSNFKSLLYLVCSVISDGDEPDNYDLLVIANDRDQAVELWRKHYGDACAEFSPDRQEDWKMRDPESVIRIPEEELLNRTPRALSWRDMDYC